ncbi:hypothetical protein [Mesorhizobium sp. M4B.F.Ca.ET.058.02.1.1]|uniref:hypothetical protein n=1 Tax=Mesorhizobium sp. M4B.F.Ca.ET.058.02.1.1 TaxID=2493675 RepID=UPI000F753FB3|nr:hypothetical protein [Mesorhizobium sp. M4B.F.Ca.ET.058.02.1.1]AZO48063.1 hypothetical protein EJ073_09720 [Mesorhizobium sp. M4B.F.Ca.ET.058.02.1.1]
MDRSSNRTRMPAVEYTITHFSSDPLAQLNHQAHGSHSWVDDEFDHFADEDTFLHHDRLAPIWEMTNAR